MADSHLADQIKKGNTLFTNKLYKILSKQSGNVFFSPFCLHAVLSMAHQGAQNETAQVLGSTLGITDASATAAAYRTVLENLQNIDEVLLNIANKIYVRKGVKLLDEFENEIREKFYGEAEVVDFDEAAETARKINEWVLEKTENIRNLVDANSINKDTSLFLINAIYFKADWMNEFPEYATETQKFYLDAKESVEVQMMHGQQSAFYKDDKDLDAEIVSLSYQGDKVRLVIILPKARDGIGKLEAELATKTLTKIFEGQSDELVELSLPKFKFETTIDFDDVVKEIGLQRIFDKDNADFKKMAKLESGENLYVGKIFQKACIAVNEQGSEALAAGFVAMDMLRCANPPEPPRVIPVVVDHPAIFMIMVVEDVHEENILFYGRLSHPEYPEF